MLPLKKKRKLNSAFGKQSCMDNFLIRQIDEVLASLPRPTAWEKFDELVTSLSGTRDEIFDNLPHDIREAENLNAYIQTEHTVRTPTSDTPAQVVFRSRTISLADLHSVKEGCCDFILERMRNQQAIFNQSLRSLGEKIFLDTEQTKA